MGGLLSLSLSLSLLAWTTERSEEGKEVESQPTTHNQNDQDEQTDSPEGETGVAAQYEPEQETDYTQWENQWQGSHRPNAGARVWGE